MRVGWLADDASYVGGAELTQAEFRAAAPDGVEIVDCPPGAVTSDCDRYAIHNCVQYSPDDLRLSKPTFKYHNDVGTWLTPDVRAMLDRAQAICCSPLQAEYMGLADAALIPPPVNLERFRQAAVNVNGNRRGAVSIGSWRNLGKGPHRIVEWARANGGIQVFGDGPFAPEGARPVEYADMPDVLASFERFVFLPTVIEPFGRTVAEAWAAGCAIVTNDLVGAKYWILEAPDKLESASEDYWKLVLA